MRVLVTGCAGFIGYHLCNRLTKQLKNNVVGVDSLNHYYSIKLKKKRLSLLKNKKNFNFKKLNLNNFKNLDNIFKNFKPDIIYHLAGQPGVLYSFKDPKSYRLNNLVATQNLCKIVKKHQIKKFIFASSSSIYGDQKKYPIKENAKPNPKNPYAKSKLACEKYLEKTFKQTKIDYVIFRFFTVYGPFGRPDMFIHKFLNNIFNRKKNYIYNFGKNFRDFTYIDDVVEILIQSIKKKLKGKIFNICRSNPIKTIDLIDIFKKNLPQRRINLVFVKAVKGEMLKTHGSNKKLKNFFKKKKFIDFRNGLEKTINIFKKNKY